MPTISLIVCEVGVMRLIWFSLLSGTLFGCGARTPELMASIGNSVGANNKFSAFQSTKIDARWMMAPADSFGLLATHSTDDGCLTMLSIFTANGPTPSAGVRHSLNPQLAGTTSPFGRMEYYEENCEGVLQTKLWRSTDGTLYFDAVSGSRGYMVRGVSLHWTGVPMMGITQPSSLDAAGYDGAGTLELTGSAVVDVQGL